MLGIGAIAHAAQFFDRDVITLALLHTSVREVSEREQDDNRGGAKFQVLAGFSGHTHTPKV